MSTDSYLQPKGGEAFPDQPFDNTEGLYVGRLVGAGGAVQTATGAFPLRLWGEILFYNQPDADAFAVQRVRRVALCGSFTEHIDDDPIRVLSLVGPLGAPEIEPGHTSKAHGLQLQLHYHALSKELPPRFECKNRECRDAVFPQVEKFAATLTWTPADQPESTAVWLEVRLSADELIDEKLGVVQSVTLDPIVVPFYPNGPREDRPATHHSLSPHCPPPPVGACISTQKRILPLCFINLSRAADVEEVCQRQIDGICEVWRNKGALDLRVTVNLVEATEGQKTNFAELGEIGESMLSDLRDANNVLYASTTQIEVYVVDRFLMNRGGGVAYDCGQASAFCILEMGDPHAPLASTARTNKYLLAHELGHVLGLAHPNEAADDVAPGSPHSIMEPGNPNPNANTLFNCRIFTDRPNHLPHNCIVETTNQPDCFRPDPEIA